MATLSSDALDAIKSRAEAIDSWVLAPVAGQHPDLTSLQLSAADVPALVAEVERLNAQLRATRVVLLPDRTALMDAIAAKLPLPTWWGGEEFGKATDDILAELFPQPAAGEAHGAAILAAKAKALREAADAAREAWVDGTWNLTVDTGQWLRDRANSIERPDRPPAADERRTPAPELAELFPGTLAALDRLSIRPEVQ